MSSFRDKLGEMFSRKKQDKPVHESLESWGLKLIADGKLADRLNALQLFFDELHAPIDYDDDPLNYLKELRTRELKLNRCIHSLASPYYRAGSSAQFREIMEGWQLWHSLALYWIDATRERIETILEEEEDAQKQVLRVTAIDMETMVRRMHTVLQFHVWQDGQLVLAESYLSLDVASATATILTTGEGYGGVDLSDLSKTKEESIE